MLDNKRKESWRIRREQRVADGWKYYNTLLPTDLLNDIKDLVRKHKKQNYDVWYPPTKKVQEQ